jgi:protein-disulfide isomerase
LVEQDYQEGVACGIAKTPTVLTGGAVLIETFTFDEISRAIDAVLGR